MTEEWVRYYDERGQRVRVRASDWARRIAPSNLRGVWDDADQLERELVLALADGVCEARIAAAEHLDELDARAQRGTEILVRALCAHGRADEARRRLTRQLARGAPSAGRLAALSHVQATLGDPAAARTSAREAIELDPNHGSALARWVESARLDPEAALQHAARLRGAWRPQLRLGRRALTTNDLQEALRHFRDAVTHAGRDRDEAMRGVATQLAASGHHAELVELLAPQFDRERSGPEVTAAMDRSLHLLGRGSEAQREQAVPQCPPLDSPPEVHTTSNGSPGHPAAPRPPRGSEPAAPPSRSQPRAAPPRERAASAQDEPRPVPPPATDRRDVECASLEQPPHHEEPAPAEIAPPPDWIPMGSPLGELQAAEGSGAARVGFLYSGDPRAAADALAQLAALPLHLAAVISGETDARTEWFAARDGTRKPSFRALVDEWGPGGGPEYVVFGQARTHGWIASVEYEVWDLRRGKLLARIELSAWSGRRGLARRLERAVGRTLAAAGAVRRRRRLGRSRWRVGRQRLFAAATLASSRLDGAAAAEDRRHLARALRTELALPDPIAWILAAGTLDRSRPQAEDWELTEALCQALDGLRDELPETLQRGFERWLRRDSGR